MDNNFMDPSCMKTFSCRNSHAVFSFVIYLPTLLKPGAATDGKRTDGEITGSGKYIVEYLGSL